MPLKLILMSPEGTIGADGKALTDILRELCMFINRMAAHGVQVALWSRHRSTLNDEPLDEYLTRQAATLVRQFTAAAGNLQARQYAGSVDPILAEFGITRHETILIGSKPVDMQAGVNNSLLLIRPA